MRADTSASSAYHPVVIGSMVDAYLPTSSGNVCLGPSTINITAGQITETTITLDWKPETPSTRLLDAHLSSEVVLLFTW